MTSKEVTKAVFDCLDEKKAIDIKIIDISKVSVIADYFVIAGASNVRQTKALAENVEDKLGRMGVDAKGREGYTNCNWILLDYGDVIIHIFNQEQRLFYDLERIWTEGKVIDAADLDAAEA